MDIKKKEKGIDVWIAIDMIKNSITNRECDVCILISGDTDFVPAINLIKERGKEVLSAFVPFGYSSELRNSTNYFIIRKETLIKCVKNHLSKTGGMNLPHFVWFLSTIRIPPVSKPQVKDLWNSEVSKITKAKRRRKEKE